jgi:GNAT superfamily N-acetyltransferase
VKTLRIEAVNDPDASIAFLSTPADEQAHSDEFWDLRAANSSVGDKAAQFVAERDGDWVGTITVLRWEAGSTDHHGHDVTAPRGDVVGVYVRPSERGTGAIDALFAAAVAWAEELGDTALALDVHVDNVRAQGAYRRMGFVDDGRRFTGTIGPEQGMTRVLLHGDEVQS